jgi:hypothetical protein
VSAFSVSSFTIACQTAPSAAQGNTTYAVSFVAIG